MKGPFGIGVVTGIGLTIGEHYTKKAIDAIECKIAQSKETGKFQIGKGPIKIEIRK